MSEGIFTSVETDKLKTREGVVALMQSSRSRLEWSANLNKIATANNGLPSFWKEAILDSGLADSKMISFRPNE